jgi:hypothetical protein
MSNVRELRVVDASIDEQVDAAFKQRLLVLLRDGYEGKELVDNMSAYLMWKYRESWGEMVDE